MILEKILESSLDCKEIQPFHPKGDQSWIFIGRTDAEAETPVLWSLDVKNWLIGKDSDAGKNWGQEEKGMTEDEMVGWHHQLNRHEFEQVLGVSDGQGSLVCCSPWGRKESDTTEQLNWTELKELHLFFTSGSGGLATESCLTFVTPWTVACKAPLSMRFSRQEYWSGLPFPSPLFKWRLLIQTIKVRFVSCSLKFLCMTSRKIAQ